jgi:PAS domain S-box-containing protein
MTAQAMWMPADPTSPGAARRLVSDVLTAQNCPDELVQNAKLLVSELVTNSVVHARSAMTLSVSVLGSLVRVEVADGSSRLPVPRLSDADAVTGRGLQLISLLADDFGFRLRGSSGKVVWFTLGSGRQRIDVDDLFPELTNDTLAISLLGVPVVLFDAWRDHASAVLREILLMNVDDADELSQRQVDEVARANQALMSLDGAIARARAASDAADRIDVAIQLPQSVISLFALLRFVLDRGQAMATRGELLSPVGQPELVALRDWFCNSVLLQAQGAAPSTWSGVPTTVPESLRQPPAWDDSAVSASSNAVIAADDTSHIIAVSRPAAALLGWSVAELLGQRIVAIMPEPMRDAHIAGFTQYLLTRRATILGKPIEVPALRRDGSQVTVTLLIRAQPVSEGRTVFVAELTSYAGQEAGTAGAATPNDTSTSAATAELPGSSP